jgi:hypothetical protein
MALAAKCCLAKNSVTMMADENGRVRRSIVRWIEYLGDLNKGACTRVDAVSS